MCSALAAARGDLKLDEVLRALGAGQLCGCGGVSIHTPHPFSTPAGAPLAGEKEAEGQGTPSAP